MTKLFDEINPFFPVSDPVLNRISEKGGTVGKTVVNPTGTALRKAVGTEKAATISDPLGYSKFTPAGKKNVATIIGSSPEELDELGYG
jgi:hypothetical protein